MIEIACPHCNARFRIEDKYAGRAYKCLACGGQISVPETTEAASSQSSARTSSPDDRRLPVDGDVAPGIGPGETATKHLKTSHRVVLVIVALTAVFAFSYWHERRTPQYSLRQIAIAVREHDLAKFEKYVDIDGVCTALTDDLLTQLLEEDANEEEMAAFAAALGYGLGQLMKPRIVEELKTQVIRSVERGQFEGEGGGSSIESDTKESRLGAEGSSRPPVEGDGQVSLLGIEGGGPTVESDRQKAPFELASSFPAETLYMGIEYVKYEGRIALVGLRFWHTEYHQDIILDLKFRDKGSYWCLGSAGIGQSAFPA